jgi:hypothetical protein
MKSKLKHVSLALQIQDRAEGKRAENSDIPSTSEYFRFITDIGHAICKKLRNSELVLSADPG